MNNLFSMLFTLLFFTTTLCTPTHKSIDACYHADGIISKDCMKQFLPDNPIILEAGAHNGSDTIELCKVWPKAKVYAFEPVPELYAQACNLARNFTQAKIYPYALSDKAGLTTLWISGGATDGASSIVEPTGCLTEYPQVTFPRTTTAQTITLDEWAQQEGVDHIDFMWLDMQGSEYLMLKAAPKILKTVRVIYTEVSLIEIYADCPLYPEYKQWLEEQGFEVVCEELPWPSMGNVLFVRSDILETLS